MAENPEVSPDVEEDALDAEAVRKQADDFKAKAAEYYDQLIRLKAEFENFRKRVEKEKKEARLWGKQEVLLELIALVDVFEQAMAQTANAKDTKQVAAGVEMLHKNFAQFLKVEGIEPLDLVGKPFDPLTAEVLAQEEVDDEDQVGKVLEEFQKGYLFQGKVLRPSRVKVGVAKSSEEKKEKSS